MGSYVVLHGAKSLNEILLRSSVRCELLMPGGTERERERMVFTHGSEVYKLWRPYHNVLVNTLNVSRDGIFLTMSTRTAYRRIPMKDARGTCFHRMARNLARVDCVTDSSY